MIPVAGDFPLGWDLVGALAGAGVGLILESRLLLYEPVPASSRVQLARIAIGGVGLLALVLAAALVRELGVDPMIRIAVFFPVGMWALLGAPWLLGRLGQSSGGAVGRAEGATEP